MKLTRVILFGAPGAGKGTQAEEIEDKFGYTKISTGDLIRAEVGAGTAIGLEVKSMMEAGELVPDKIIVDLLKRRLNRGDIENGYITDGFPRTIYQAEELSGMPVHKEVAIYLDIPDESVVVRRLLSRLTCTDPECGAIFNLEENPPKQAGRCDDCGKPLKQRADDNEETIRNRISVYKEQTQPVIDYYREKGSLHEINALGTIEDVFEEITQLINAER